MLEDAASTVYIDAVALRLAYQAARVDALTLSASGEDDRLDLEYLRAAAKEAGNLMKTASAIERATGRFGKPVLLIRSNGDVADGYLKECQDALGDLRQDFGPRQGGLHQFVVAQRRPEVRLGCFVVAV